MPTPAHDLIAAPATAAGGAIAVIRVSGEGAAACCDRIFRGSTPLAQAAGYTAHFGRIVAGERVVDEVVATLFRAPRSYTGDETVELACHGSPYIVGEVLRLLAEEGVRMAEPGEFTIRAYLAGKMDLAQAEAVADLVAASSQAAHTLATRQMRGAYSAALDALRDRLLHLVALLELELDFGEEDVAFADRSELRTTMQQLAAEIDALRRSFALGNALRDGVPVAIAGAPNVGKSTLLNRLAGDERAIVSEIAGTTRDLIEERINIDGVLFRLLDTAGLRETDDRLERMGIERTRAGIERARIVVRVVDVARIAGGVLPPPDFVLRDDQRLITVVNKLDTAPGSPLPEGTIGLSARCGTGIEALRQALLTAVGTELAQQGETIVTNSRHYELLTSARRALDAALEGLDTALPTDLLSEEIREVTRCLGSITGRGTILPDEVLRSIFSSFCIGK